MCRNIKILCNFDPPVTAEEVRAASLQFVRKISGFKSEGSHRRKIRYLNKSRSWRGSRQCPVGFRN